jgi:hypothetical protein
MGQLPPGWVPASMGSVTIDIGRPIDLVWSGVVDAERYPKWLLGAQKVSAPSQWPESGSSFAHRIGIGPFRISGSTTVREIQRRDRFRLGAGMGPFGEADVTFELEALGLVNTRVKMIEAPSDGLLALLGRIAGPLVDRIINARNVESLRLLRVLL